MYELLCIIYNDYHLTFCIVRSVLKVPTLFTYHGDIAKTGDTSSLRCRFQSKKTYTTVVNESYYICTMFLLSLTWVATIILRQVMESKLFKEF